MIKVLWIINVPTSRISEKLMLNSKDCAGWLNGYANELEKCREIDLTIAFPLLGTKKIVKENIGKIKYVSFYQQQINNRIKISTNRVTQLTKQHIEEILNAVKPDILHIFGTEYEHSLIAAKLFNNPSKTVVHIQGLTSVYALHYCAGLPLKVLKKFAFSNFIRGNILKQKTKMELRAKSEIELLSNINNVCGRTDWDYACVKRINPEINYYFCNESLRDEFYKYKWNLMECNKHSIFFSQGNYPIKGLHFMIEAMPDIIKRFKDAHLYIAGNDITKTDGFYNKIKISSYGLYIKELIKKEKLEKKITFLGFLSEKEMCQRNLKSNVFVSASSIENSPNSVGEALILGVPVVVSDVGGVKNFVLHGYNGFIYQYDAPYMLAYYINEIFANDKLANEFSLNAQTKASLVYDRKINIEKLKSIYGDIDCKI